MSAQMVGIIDQIEAIDMVSTVIPGGEFSAIPTGIRVHVLNRGGGAWLEWPRGLDHPTVGQRVSLALSAS